MNQNPADKLVRQRLSVLELAKALGNVSEACRQRDISRQTFYEYKRRFEKHGLEGLKDLPPIPKSHPNATPDEHIERLLALSLDHPAWGCNRLSDHLKLDGISISAPTVQNVLNKHDYGTKHERWLRLEKHAAGKGRKLSDEQVRFLEKQNPQWRERHVESSRPGELLSQDTFYVGHFKGVGKVYLHAVVDTYSSHAFGFLHTSKQPEAAVAVLHNEVVPFYAVHEIPIAAVLTDNGTEFCGTPEHPYELYLRLCEVGHRRTRVRRPQTNGFVERFNRTVKEEFFEVAMVKTFYASVEQLQGDLDAWLHYYNRERTHQGYRNQGRRPYDTIQRYLNARSRSVKKAS
jgi:transposase InsO family protein